MHPADKAGWCVHTDEGEMLMDAREAILNRRSVRKFNSDKIDKELINQLLEAGFAAPSACNKRPLEFFVVTNEDKLERLQGAGRFTDISAPLVIIVGADMKRTLPRSFSEYWIHDAGAATENILIRASSLGLGSLWCGVYLQKQLMDKVIDILDLPENVIPFSMIKIGYAAEEIPPHSGIDSEHVKFFD